MSQSTIAVVGAGSWGTALALNAARCGHRVRLWSRRAEHRQELRQQRSNQRYLPGYELPTTIGIAGSEEEAFVGSDLVVWVVPSHGFRSALRNVKPWLPKGVPFVSCSKGIELHTLALMSEVFAQEVGQAMPFACLGGPSFAKEVAEDHPTAVCVASADAAVAQGIQAALARATFRIYTSRDVVGVELAGALKNVIALAVGCSDGLGFGANSRAALITRGIAEIGRLGDALGADPLTFAGLAGMGDLVLTCTGDLSRNRRVGLALGQGKSVAEATDSGFMVAEGVKTARAAMALADRHGVDMPITREAFCVLYEGKSPQEAVRSLTERDFKEERSLAAGSANDAQAPAIRMAGGEGVPTEGHAEGIGTERSEVLQSDFGAAQLGAAQGSAQLSGADRTAEGRWQAALSAGAQAVSNREGSLVRGDELRHPVFGMCKLELLRDDHMILRLPSGQKKRLSRQAFRVEFMPTQGDGPKAALHLLQRAPRESSS